VRALCKKLYNGVPNNEAKIGLFANFRISSQEMLGFCDLFFS